MKESEDRTANGTEEIQTMKAVVSRRDLGLINGETYIQKEETIQNGDTELGTTLKYIHLHLILSFLYMFSSYKYGHANSTEKVLAQK